MLQPIHCYATSTKPMQNVNTCFAKKDQTEHFMDNVLLSIYTQGGSNFSGKESRR